MVLPVAGQLPLSLIELEFGGTPPTNLSEYYRNGAFVTANNTGVPESGELALSDFYGTEALTTAYEQVLTGSGTFTPLYSSVPAIIQIGGGGGSGGAFVQAYGESSSLRGKAGGQGAGDAIFVNNISDFAGGLYSVGLGGVSPSWSCYASQKALYGSYGNQSYLRSPSNSPWSIYAGRGGRGGYGSAPYQTAPSDPMSGIYNTDLSNLPSQVLFNAVIVNPSTLMTTSTGGAGSAGFYGVVDRYPQGGSIPVCPYTSNGGSGFLRIYYIV